MAFSNTQHLLDVLETHRMKHVQAFVDKMSAKRDEIAKAISTYYNGSCYEPFNSGSMAKHTATNVKFDMDIVIPFKHDAFDKLEDMYNDVFDFLDDKYKDVATVRKQKVSIGISFPIEAGDDKPVEIDVVPGRETSIGSYKESKDLNIYVRKSNWGLADGSYMKTNIQNQRDFILGKNSERQIIRLLKIWKKQNAKPYKSCVIELAVIEAFEGYTGDPNLWERLKYAMEYLRNNINDNSYHLYDPGNSNNDVVASMSQIDRSALKSDLTSMLINIESNPSVYLPYYFKINDKYKGYGEKSQGSPYPTTTKRFGY